MHVQFCPSVYAHPVRQVVRKTRDFATACVVALMPLAFSIENLASACWVFCLALAALSPLRLSCYLDDMYLVINAFVAEAITQVCLSLSVFVASSCVRSGGNSYSTDDGDIAAKLAKHS